MVYIDEAQDYFDRNIGLILAQARKYNVGMVLAHQYLGQLEPKLQEAFAANTAIKFAGGVSAKDARSLAPMLYTDPAFIEAQGKGSFAAHIRGVTKHAVPLSFPFGYLEDLPVMTSQDRAAQRELMRERYAVHHSQIGTDESDDDAPEGDGGDVPGDDGPKPRKPKPSGPKPKGPSGSARQAKGATKSDDKKPTSPSKDGRGLIDTTPGDEW